jgi:hypothetical protein
MTLMVEHAGMTINCITIVPRQYPEANNPISFPAL